MEIEEENQTPRTTRIRRTREEALSLYEQVRALRNRGLLNKQIALRLRVKETTIAGAVQKLIRIDQLKPRRQLRSKGRLIVFDQKVMELRKQGNLNKEIARKLRVSMHAVNQSTMRLISTGQIERRHRPKGPNTFLN